MSEPRLPDLARSFERHLRAENKSDRTVETYLEAVRLLKAFLARRGVDLAEADRAQIEAFLADLLARWKPATAANRYRSLKVFYAWLEDEGEITADPMAKMKPPAIPEQPIPVVPDEALRRLFAACAGKDFEARRDTAMIMLLLDSGARRAELVGLRVEDLDFEHDVARVIGKGRRERALPFGRKTAVALDRYLRVRSRHAHAASPWLWLGQKGPLTATGPGADALAPRPPGRHRGPARAPAAPHVRPRLARPGWARDGSHADRWLAVTRDAPALRRLSRRRARPRGTPAPLAT